MIHYAIYPFYSFMNGTNQIEQKLKEKGCAVKIAIRLNFSSTFIFLVTYIGFCTDLLLAITPNKRFSSYNSFQVNKWS